MRMPRLVGAALAAAFAGLASAANLTAVYGGLGSSHNVDGQSIQGGLFEITINNTFGLSAGDLGGDMYAGSVFKSFCIEVGETINFGGSYNFDVNTVSENGGASPNDPQPLTVETAWLYTQFRSNAGFADTNDEVNALQDAIWFFQLQLGDAVATDLSSLAQGYITQAQNSGWTNIGSVRVLNVGPAGQQFPNQDMLALVPLPQGVGLASAGLLILGARRRRGV